jgi:hypothetical protein
MTRLSKLGNTERLNGQRTYTFWRSWFASTVAGLLLFVSLHNSSRDLGSFLLVTADASTSNEDNIRKSSAENRQLSIHSIKHVPEEVYFLNGNDLSYKDGFSASWLQSREDFLTMPFDGKFLFGR